MKKSILAVLALALLYAGPAMSQAGNAAKQQDIRKLMELTGAAKVGQQIAAQMIPMFKQSNPQVPQKFWDDVMKEFDAKSMIDLVVPIYDKHRPTTTSRA
jgi:hypothetical protein